jgi:hypothetical protein
VRKRRDALVTSAVFHSPLKGSPAFASECSNQNQIPERVLDIGCGITPFWILEMASREGWEKTEFVGAPSTRNASPLISSLTIFHAGLDIAPSSVTIDLPADIDSRVSFIQTSFALPLPFRAEFGYVRIAHVNLALQGEHSASAYSRFA